MKKFILYLIVFFTALIFTSSAAMAKINANVKITNPDEGAVFEMGQTINVSVSMSPAVAGTAKKLTVKITRENKVIAEEVINNPQAGNQVPIKIPIKAILLAFPNNKDAVVEAQLSPNENLTGYNNKITVYIKDFPSDIKITNPAPYSVFYPGQSLDVTVTLNSAIIGMSEKLVVLISKGKKESLEIFDIKQIPDYKVNNQVVLQLPPNVPEGELEVNASLYPNGGIAGTYTTNIIKIGKIDSQLTITSPVNGSTFYPGQTVNVSAAVNTIFAKYVKQVSIVIKKGEQIIAQQSIENLYYQPKSNYDAQLQIPADTVPGDAVIEASISPKENFTPYAANINIKIAKVDAQLKITNPADGSVFNTGESVNVSADISSEAVKLAKQMVINIKKGAQVIAGTGINEPKVNNQAVLQIPENTIPGDAVIEAALYPAESFTISAVSINIKIEKFDAKLKIINPASGTLFKQGETVNVAATINPAAAGKIKKLILGILKDNKVIAQTIIDNPQANNQAALQIPLDTTPGDAVIKAGIQESNTAGNTDSVNIEIAKVDAQLKLTNPVNGSVFNPGQTINVFANMNSEAAKFANQLVIKIKNGEQIIAQTPINNPQANNQVTLQIPVNASAGDAVIEASLLPAEKFVNSADSINIKIEKIDAQVKIANPATGTVFKHKEPINISISMNPQIVGQAKQLFINLIKGGQIVAQTSINNPQIHNQAVLQIPADLTGGDAVIKAFLPDAYFFSNNSDTVSIKIEVIRALLDIINPADGTVFEAGRSIDIATSMSPSAVGPAKQLSVKLLAGMQSIAETTINNPQIHNEVKLQIPSSAPAGDAIINATLLPQENFIGHIDNVNIKIDKLNANLKIVSPANYAVFKTGQKIDVSVSMNPAAVGLAKKLFVILVQEGKKLFETQIDNPQTHNQVAVQIPENAAGGDAAIAASISPQNSFKEYSHNAVIIIEKIDPKLKITSPANGSIIPPASAVNITVTINSEVIGKTGQLVIRIIKGGISIAETTVNEPQASNQAQLQIPGATSPGDAVIEAYLPQVKGVPSASDSVPIKIAR